MILLFDYATEIGVLATTAGFVISVSTIGYLIRRHGWVPFKEKYITARKIKRQKVEKIIETSEKNQEMLEWIKGQLQTNGGSTIKDMLVDLKSTVERQTARSKHMDENSHIAIFELNQDGDMTFANAAFKQLVHADEGELMGSAYLGRMHRQDRDAFIDERDQDIKECIPIDMTVRFKTRGSSYVEVALKANPDVRNNKLLGFWGTGSRPGCDPSLVPFGCPLAKKDK